MWLFFLVIAGFFCTDSACARAATDKPIPFIATYKTITFNLTMGKTFVTNTRMFCDGHGNIKVHCIQPDGKVGTDAIYIGANDALYQLRADEKLSMELESGKHRYDPWLNNWVKNPPTNEMRALGARVVSNHPSHGYFGKSRGQDGEIWIADDLRIPTLTKSDFDNGTLENQLIDYKRSKSVVAFSLPTGYKKQTSSQYMMEKSGGHTSGLDLSIEDRTRLEVFLSIAESVLHQYWIEHAADSLNLQSGQQVVVHCKLIPEGTITEIKVSESSGNTAMDDLALQTVNASNTEEFRPKKLSRPFEANLTFVFSDGDTTVHGHTISDAETGVTKSDSASANSDVTTTKN